MAPPDSVTGRVLPWLSMMGSGVDTVGEHPLTKSRKRLPISIGSSLFRRFVCTEGCYVCCAVLSLSLDYIPTESAWRENPRRADFLPRLLLVNGREYEVLSNMRKTSSRKEPRRFESEERLKELCSFLGTVRDGNPGCTLWKTGSPLGCASAYLMRVSEHPSTILITKQGMARAWRYDPSPECEFLSLPLEESDVETNVRLFQRFLEWAEYFRMPVSVERISAIVGTLEEILRTGNVPSSIVIP